MSLTLKSLAASVALALTLTLPGAATQPAEDVGTIKVTVVDAQGNPIKNLKVQLKSSPRQPAFNGVPGPAPGILIDAKDTDNDGKVEFTNLTPGAYRLSCGNAEMGRGFSPVRVEAGKVHDIQLVVKKNL